MYIEFKSQGFSSQTRQTSVVINETGITCLLVDHVLQNGDYQMQLLLFLVQQLSLCLVALVTLQGQLRADLLLDSGPSARIVVGCRLRGFAVTVLLEFGGRVCYWKDREMKKNICK